MRQRGIIFSYFILAEQSVGGHSDAEHCSHPVGGKLWETAQNLNTVQAPKFYFGDLFLLCLWADVTFQKFYHLFSLFELKVVKRKK